MRGFRLPAVYDAAGRSLPSEARVHRSSGRQGQLDELVYIFPSHEKAEEKLIIYYICVYSIDTGSLHESFIVHECLKA